MKLNLNLNLNLNLDLIEETFGTTWVGARAGVMTLAATLTYLTSLAKTLATLATWATTLVTLATLATLGAPMTMTQASKTFTTPATLAIRL